MLRHLLFHSGHLIPQGVHIRAELYCSALRRLIVPPKLQGKHTHVSMCRHFNEKTMQKSRGLRSPQRSCGVHVSGFIHLLGLHEALVLLRDGDAPAFEALGALPARILLRALLGAALGEGADRLCCIVYIPPVIPPTPPQPGATAARSSRATSRCIGAGRGLSSHVACQEGCEYARNEMQRSCQFQVWAGTLTVKFSPLTASGQQWPPVGSNPEKIQEQTLACTACSSSEWAMQKGRRLLESYSGCSRTSWPDHRQRRSERCHRHR
jgi:hypothetical protein